MVATLRKRVRYIDEDEVVARGKEAAVYCVHDKLNKNEEGDGTPSAPFRLPLRASVNKSACSFCPTVTCYCQYFDALFRQCAQHLSIKRIDMRYRHPHLCAKSILPPFVSRMIRIISSNPPDDFFDLGCGNGSVVLQVAAQTGAKCIGVELDPHNAAVAQQYLEYCRPILEKKFRRPLNVTIVNADLCEWLNTSADGVDVFKKRSCIWLANLLFPKPVNHFLSEKLRAVPSETNIFCFEDLYPHSRSVARIRDRDAFEKFLMYDYAWQLSSVEWCDVEGSFYRYVRK